MTKEYLAKVLIMDDPNLLTTEETIKTLMLLEAGLPKVSYLAVVQVILGKSAPKSIKAFMISLVVNKFISYMIKTFAKPKNSNINGINKMTRIKGGRIFPRIKNFKDIPLHQLLKLTSPIGHQ